METKPLFALASTCLLLAACASGGAASDVSALVGKYQSEQSIAIFNADGSFTGTTPDGKEWVRGTYTVDGDTMTMVDTWEDTQVLTERCEGIAGRYAWKIDNDTLTAQAIEDTCKGRAETINGMAWKRVR
jgi:hypothetical protein